MSIPLAVIGFLAYNYRYKPVITHALAEKILNKRLHFIVRVQNPYALIRVTGVQGNMVQCFLKVPIIVATG